MMIINLIDDCIGGEILRSSPDSSHGDVLQWLRDQYIDDLMQELIDGKIKENQAAIFSKALRIPLIEMIGELNRLGWRVEFES